MLTDLLRDSQSFGRLCAAEALGRIGPDARPAAPELRKCLKDQSPGVRTKATIALKAIGDEAPAE
jgi:HEAT repeat protein